MKNVAAYCRVSTKKDDQINSFEAQKEFFTEYAEREGLSLVHIYADEGITGTSTKNRTEFNKMMADSEKGIFESILVKDVSRLARNTVDFLQSVRKLKALDIDMLFVNSNMKTLGDSEFILTLLAALAQEESGNMSKRVKFGKKINAEKGRVPNLCFGYIKTKGDYFNLQINDSEAEIVREIFDLYVNQGCGSHKISKILNSRGLTSLRGVPWSTTAVSRILKNKIYAGYVVNGKTSVKDFIEKTRTIHDESQWIEIEKPELQIIPLDLWEKAQNVNKSNNIELNTTLHKKRGNKHLFSTLITCPVCGYSFRRIKVERKNYTRIYWSCSGRNHNGSKSCNNMSIVLESELIENIDNYFRSIIADKHKFISDIVNQYQKNQPQNQSIVLSSHIEKLEIKKKKQIVMFEADIITIEELKEKTAEIEKQIAQIKLDLDNSETVEDIEKKLKQLYKALCDNFSRYSSIANMTNAELKELLKGIIVDENGNIQIELNY